MKLHACILVSVARQHLPNEREMYVEARFGGLEVTLGDEQGYILSADMTGMHCFIVNLNIFTQRNNQKHSHWKIEMVVEIMTNVIAL